MKTFYSLLLLLITLNTFAEDTTEVVKTAPENEIKTDSQLVKVKKKDDGSSIYNFNFFNNGPQNKKQENESSTTSPIENKNVPNENLVIVKQTTKKGSGVEGAIFMINNLGKLSKVANLDFGLGIKIGFVFMSSTSGLYFTPGVFVVDVKANNDNLGSNFSTAYESFHGNDSMGRNYKGSAFGGSFKIGRLMEQNALIAIDAGIEGGYMSGDLNTDTIFGNGTYHFQSLNASAYGGPVFTFNNIHLKTLFNVGVANINAKETYTDHGYFGYMRDYIEKKALPFWGLSVNASFVF